MKSPRQLDAEVAEKLRRSRLQRRVEKLLDKWQPILGVRVADFHVKKMTSWGSLNPEARRLWVSEALADMSDAALEYVVVHELAHLTIDEGPKGSGHDVRFYALLDRVLPTWRRRHARLSHGDVRAKALPGMR